MSLTDPYVQQATAMPAMPEVAHKLLRSFERDDMSLGELSSLIARDQTLAAKVMRLANSARYSPSHAVASLNDAAASLGLRTLRDLTLSACMTGAFPQPVGFDRLSFWRSTLAVASYAQMLAPALDADPDTAYLGGLMLRTGQLLMVMVDPAGVAEVASHAVTPDSQIGFESAILGCSHPEITAELARHWHFPQSLVKAFGSAVDPMETRPFCRLGAVLRLASVICDCANMGVPVADGLRLTQPALLAHVNLDLDWLVAHLPDHRLAVSGADALMH
ncbi:HDOD domain-containing protein [Ideonella sp.]|uniref:HDOD domain-containing protein n=1 Tax=Ideonella sp. TaxID=1929293 RepID=UPI003BB52DB4